MAEGQIFIAKQEEALSERSPTIKAAARAPWREAVWQGGRRVSTAWKVELDVICPVRGPVILFLSPSMSRWAAVLLRRESRQALLVVSALSPVQPLFH